MPATLNDYVKARAIPALVNYHRDMGGRDSDWTQTTAFAYSEFRGATAETITALIRMARAAAIAAQCQRGLACGERLSDDIIPGI